ncbi:MAG: hypothetical protein ACFFHV_00010 [Promethearchaeota archaeon]
MVSRITKKKWLIVLFSILFVFMLNSLLLNKYFSQNYIIKDNSNNSNDIFEENNLDIQKLSSDNVFSDYGAPWNLTHYANKTSYNLPVEFTNNSYDTSQGVEMPENWQDWEAYKMSANISNLYDTRNWCNGTFNFGNDNDYQTPQANDSATIPRISNNQFQNWAFSESDQGSNNNPTSGNYIDSSSISPVNSLGHDCVELRINGRGDSEPRYWYDAQDRCWWESEFHIQRGRLIDCTFFFEVNPYHLVDSNTFEIVIYLNNVYIYSYGVFELEQEKGEGVWINRSIPISTWLNTSNVFPDDILDNSDIDVRVTLRHNMDETVGYGPEDGSHTNYQQVLIDNVQLITKAEAYPTDLGLQMNNSLIDNVFGQWGKGYKTVKNFKLQNNKIFANFSSNQIENLSLFEENGELIRYKIEFKADVNLFALQNTPETLYDTIPNAEGTNFVATNNSNTIDWNCYGYVNVSSGYAETELTLEFPTDLFINTVYDAADPLINISGESYVDHSVDGRLIIDSVTPAGLSNGYWAFEGKSPNYCTQLSLYNNYSGSWIYNTTFMSGDYINITAKINDSSLVKDYIEDTSAILRIRFPDGNLWTAEEQIKSPNINGIVSFDPIRIPDISGPTYQAGNYEAIVIWNNSHSIFRFNETGIIFMNFSVIHESIFKTRDDIYYFDEILEDETLIVKFSFKDLIDNSFITDAYVYAKNQTGQTQVLSEPSDGAYWLIYDASKVSLGNNSLTIFASHPYYLNQEINITVYVVQETTFHIEDDFITDVSYNLNFTVQFNYTLLSSGNGITTNPTTNWHPGDYYFDEITPQGNYILECNTTSYIAGDVITFQIYLNKYTYQSQIIEVSVLIDELESNIEYFVNGISPPADNKFIVEVDEFIDITVNYTSVLGEFLSGANITLVGWTNFEENLGLNLYTLTIFSGDLDQGVTILEIIANKTNYVNQEVKFFIEVTEQKTFYEIYLNGKNETLNPFISVKIGNYINITVKYFDNETKSHISNASIYFMFNSIIYNLTENLSYKHYFIILDSYILNVGIKTFELNIRKNNYQWFNPDILIQVEKLQTEISTDDDEDIYEIKAGEDFTITIILKDLDNNLRISGAVVSYEWKHGDDDFDEKGNGEYEATLEDVPRGTYTITITVVESSNIYNFEEYEITLKALRTEEDTLLWQILLVIAIITGAAFASYIVYYQKVLKYPRPVRKVRKYRKTLKKRKPPYKGKNITDREKGFKDLYKNQIAKISSSLKVQKTVEPKSSEDKISKKKLKNTTEKQITETSIGSQKKIKGGEE